MNIVETISYINYIINYTKIVVLIDGDQCTSNTLSLMETIMHNNPSYVLIVDQPGKINRTKFVQIISQSRNKDAVDMTITSMICCMYREFIKEKVTIVLVTRDHFALNLKLEMNLLGVSLDIINTDERHIGFYLLNLLPINCLSFIFRDIKKSLEHSPLNIKELSVAFNTAESTIIYELNILKEKGYDIGYYEQNKIIYPAIKLINYESYPVLSEINTQINDLEFLSLGNIGHNYILDDKLKSTFRIGTWKGLLSLSGILHYLNSQLIDKSLGELILVKGFNVNSINSEIFLRDVWSMYFTRNEIEEFAIISGIKYQMFNSWLAGNLSSPKCTYAVYNWYIQEIINKEIY